MELREHKSLCEFTPQVIRKISKKFFNRLRRGAILLMNPAKAG